MLFQGRLEHTETNLMHFEMEGDQCTETNLKHLGQRMNSNFDQFMACWRDINWTAPDLQAAFDERLLCVLKNTRKMEHIPNMTIEFKDMTFSKGFWYEPRQLHPDMHEQLFGLQDRLFTGFFNYYLSISCTNVLMSVVKVWLRWTNINIFRSRAVIIQRAPWFNENDKCLSDSRRGPAEHSIGNRNALMYASLPKLIFTGAHRNSRSQSLEIRHIDFVTTCLPCLQNDIAALSKYRTAYYILLSAIVLNVDLFWPFCK